MTILNFCYRNSSKTISNRTTFSVESFQNNSLESHQMSNVLSQWAVYCAVNRYLLLLHSIYIRYFHLFVLIAAHYRAYRIDFINKQLTIDTNIDQFAIFVFSRFVCSPLFNFATNFIMYLSFCIDYRAYTLYKPWFDFSIEIFIFTFAFGYHGHTYWMNRFFSFDWNLLFVQISYRLSSNHWFM